jgi:hypothetical protein
MTAWMPQHSTSQHTIPINISSWWWVGSRVDIDKHRAVSATQRQVSMGSGLGLGSRALNLLILLILHSYFFTSVHARSLARTYTLLLHLYIHTYKHTLYTCLFLLLLLSWTNPSITFSD